MDSAACSRSRDARGPPNSAGHSGAQEESLLRNRHQRSSSQEFSTRPTTQPEEHLGLSVPSRSATASTGVRAAKIERDHPLPMGGRAASVKRAKQRVPMKRATRRRRARAAPARAEAAAEEPVEDGRRRAWTQAATAARRALATAAIVEDEAWFGTVTDPTSRPRRPRRARTAPSRARARRRGRRSRRPCRRRTPRARPK